MLELSQVTSTAFSPFSTIVNFRILPLALVFEEKQEAALRDQEGGALSPTSPAPRLAPPH